MTGTSFYGVEKHVEGLTGGSTQAETRLYNERLILSLIRRRGSLSKVELARLTALAPQTITTIVNRLAAGGLLSRGEPLRGRLGQPSVPYGLNPNGAYAFGLNIGRRAAELVMINFVGAVIATEDVAYDYPSPDAILAFAKEGVARMMAAQGGVERKRVTGMGIASPFEMWNWAEEDVPTGSLSAWREIDVRAELDRFFAWPVYLLSDAMMASAAELMFGCGETEADFLSITIGHFIGGGVVIDHRMFPGNNKRAGSIGDVVVQTRGSAQSLQNVASLSALSARLGRTVDNDEAWGETTGAVTEWIDDAAEGITTVVGNAAALLDFNAAVIDGAMPANVRKALVKAVRQRAAETLVGRPEPFVVLEGKFGALAPALGAAAIPFLVNYSNDRDVLFKDWAAAAASLEADSEGDRSVA